METVIVKLTQRWITPGSKRMRQTAGDLGRGLRDSLHLDLRQ